MAGTIICDYIRADANKISLNVGNTIVASINASGILSNTGSVIVNVNGQIPNTAISGTITQSQLATNVVGKGPAFWATSSGAFGISAGSTTKIPLNTEVFDTDGFFDSSTNYRFLPTIAGYYQINVTGVGTYGTSNNAGYYYVGIFKNGSLYSNPAGHTSCSNGNYAQCAGSALIYMNGSTDYLELYIGTNNSGTFTLQQQGTTLSTSMSGFLARAA